MTAGPRRARPATPANLRVLGYIRASTDKQAISPEVQADQLRNAHELLGWGELILRREDAASAKSLDGRPVLATALDDLRDGRADALAVAKLDRLSRSTADFAGLLDRSEREGWSLICLDLGVDTSTNAGRFASEVTAAAASLERRLIAQRTREGMARIRATSGKHMGRPSTMAPEVEARIVELHDDGMSASAISRLFNDEGVDKGPEARSAMWNHSHIRAAVRRAEVRRAAQSCDVA